ncbi:MAG: hypothetical protein DWQ06_15195 [Calditrichaeota bacterium]|nr:MAG: hypothetical protein DWQ06_15195 [Calditrichota bacterium]
MQTFVKILLMFLLLQSAFAQNTRKKIDVNKSELQNLKNSIKSLEKKLKEQKKLEASEIKALENYKEQIGLLSQVIANLEQEKKNKEIEISSLKTKLKNSEEELKKRREIFAKRLSFIQKTKRLNELELLLTSESFPESLRRLKFLFLLSEEDRKNIEKISEIKSQIATDKVSLETEVVQKKRVIAEKAFEEKSLLSKRQKKKQVLQKIKKDREFLAKDIEDKKVAAEQLEGIIDQLEKIRLAEIERAKREAEERAKKGKKGQKSERQKFFSAIGSFSKNKGKLSWPVSGKIVRGFGQHKDPKLLTITENPGIDIKTKVGANVRAVASGKVILLTYLRGYGNTIIIDHDDGFYTVYSHVTNISVVKDTYIQAGEKVGTVEESQISSGGIFHFEVWKDRKKQNPKSWLAKN